MKQPSRNVWMSRAVWMTVLTIAFLVGPGRAGAQDGNGNGSLKVTSFPSGANVSVDGNDTGKVTPMSVSVSVGTHTVMASIPNSSWNPDMRSVDVESGNNDLSVTLLPVSTIGPPGPPGAAATIQVGTTTTVVAGMPASVLNGGTANAAVLNFLIPQGLKGDRGPTGPTGGLIGRQEFQSSGTFVVHGVSRLSVELYGAGGGGIGRICNNGGGGGGGAYASTILAVQEGQTLTINVGSGGSPATSSAASGGPGGDTQVLDASGAVLAVTHGGGGGQRSCGCGPPCIFLD